MMTFADIERRFVERKEMRPGTIFVPYLGAAQWPRDALVVLDAKHEVGFWTGTLFQFGDCAPSVRFEVLA